MQDSFKLGWYKSAYKQAYERIQLALKANPTDTYLQGLFSMIQNPEEVEEAASKEASQKLE